MPDTISGHSLPRQRQGRVAGGCAEACSAGHAVTTAGPAAGRGGGSHPAVGLTSSDGDRCRSRSQNSEPGPTHSAQPHGSLATQGRASRSQTVPWLLLQSHPTPSCLCLWALPCAGQVARWSLRKIKFTSSHARSLEESHRPHWPHGVFVQTRKRHPFIWAAEPHT